MLMLVVLIILCCAVLVAWSWVRPRGPSPPVYPGALPLIGHGHLLLGDAKYIWEIQKKLYSFALKSGGIVELRFGTHHIYVLTDPAESVELANKCLEKPYFYRFAEEMFNSGLITASYSTWKSHRKLLNPAFGQQVLNTFVSQFNLQARNLTSLLAIEVNKDPFNVHRYLIDNLLNTVCQTSLGLKKQEQNMINKDYVLVTEHVYDLFRERFQKVWIQKVLGNQDRDLTKDDLPKLVYLDAVLKESLRLYPSAPAVARSICSDVQLRNYKLAAGSTCLISVYGINRRPVWGADAEQFKPERWLDPTTLPDNPNAFATFSVGKRNCIGKVYAMMVMKTTLAHILRKYCIIGDISKIQTACDILIRPMTDKQICIKMRT